MFARYIFGTEIRRILKSYYNMIHRYEIVCLFEDFI